MNNYPFSFRDELLNKETIHPELKSKYDQEIKTMLEKKLNLTQRIAFICVGIMTFVLAIIFAWVSITAQDLPLSIRGMFGIGTVFALAWSGVIAYILHRGSINLRNHSNWMTGLCWGFVVLMSVGFMLITGQKPDSIKSVYMLVTMLFYLIFGVAFLIQNHVAQIELRQKEQLLKIQLQLAELSEKMNSLNPKQDI